MTDPSADTASTLTSTAAAAPIARRTVLAGSALAVPAIMMVASTPAFAASGLTLAFDQSSYTGQGCSTISGASVSASDGGTSKSGISVTVSLSNGYTFSSGGTSATGLTGSGGSWALPDINVPGNGGDGTATATSAGASAASAALSGTSSASNVYLHNNYSNAAVGVPSGSAPIYGTVFLSTDGRLIDGSSGKLIITNVDAVGQGGMDANNVTWAPLKMRDGSFFWLRNDVATSTVGVPSGSTASYGAAFLAPDGRLIDGTNGNTIVANVDTFGRAGSDAKDVSWVPLKMRDGSFIYLRDNYSNAAVGVPSGSTPAYGAAFLAPDGRLLDGMSGNTITSDVDTFGLPIGNSNNDSWVPLKKRAQC